MALTATRSLCRGTQTMWNFTSCTSSWINRSVQVLPKGKQCLTDMQQHMIHTGRPSLKKPLVASLPPSPDFSRYTRSLLGAVREAPFHLPCETASSLEDLEEISKAFGIALPSNFSPILFSGKDFQEICLDYALQACKERKWELIESIKEPLSRLKDKDGRTLFLLAVEKNEEVVVRELAKRDVTDYNSNAAGNTALHIAAQKGSSYMIRILSQYFVVDALNKQGLSPLTIALINGNKAAVKTLKAFRKTAVRKSSERLSPLAIAILYGQVECIDILLRGLSEEEKRTVLKEQSDLGTILQLAVFAGQLHTIEHLFQNYTVVMRELLETPDKHGRTPFLNACLKGSLEIMQFLKKWGVNALATDHKGCSALHLAILGKSPDLIPVLAYWGVPVNEGREKESKELLKDA